MTRSGWAVKCNLINIHTHRYLVYRDRSLLIDFFVLSVIFGENVSLRL